MNRHPQAVVVVDPNKEKNAIIEARKLGITTVALIDTDCNPDEIDLPIPGNDDGIRSIEVIARHLADAVAQGTANLSHAEKKGASAGAQTANKAAADAS